MRSVGCSVLLTIENTSSIPWQIKSEMHNYGKITSYCREDDYVIEGLENILSNITIEKSLLIWECLLNAKDCQAQCSYRPNASSPTTTADATFIRQLKNAAWLPDKDGHFHRPSEISIKALHEKFIHKRNNDCIEALGIGAKEKELEKLREQEALRRREQDTQAREEGFVSQNEKEEYIEIAKLAREHGLSAEALKEMVAPKRKKPEFPNRPVTSPERREQKINERATAASQKTYERKERSVRTSKNKIDPRNMLRNLYTTPDDEMVCQICCDEMPFKDRAGQSYFKAVELFTADLVGIEDESLYIGLCPTCAAKYKEFIKSDSTVMKSLLKNIIHLDKFSDGVPIRLENKEERLHFVEKHWFDLVTLLNNVIDVSQSSKA